MPRWLSLKHLLLLLAAAGAGIALWIEWRALTSDPAPMDLSRKTMAQAVVHCRALWLASHWDQPPLAIAWHPQGLDWYVLEGADDISMQRYACTDAGIERGPRFARLLVQRAPAVPEVPVAPAAQATPTEVPRRNLFDHLAALPDTDLLALEAAHDFRDPASAGLVERRWPREGAAQVTGAAAADLPQLFSPRSTAPAALATAPYAALDPLPTINWIQRPEAVFSLLGDLVPDPVRIAKLSFDATTIYVTIIGRFENSEGRQPSRYGDNQIDAYGVRDHEDWYPRDEVTLGCSQGRTLAEVRALYAQAANVRHPELLGASYSCDPKTDDGDAGRWRLRIPRRSR